MNEILFWMLFIMGGLLHFRLISKIKKSQEAPTNLFYLNQVFSSSFRLINIGLLIWIGLWGIGTGIYFSSLSFGLGMIPIGLFLLTWGSFLFIIIREKLQISLSYYKEKKMIDPALEEWKKGLPDGYSVNKIDWVMTDVENGTTGRINIDLTFHYDADIINISWMEKAEKLRSQFKFPIIIKIKCNGKIVYPTWDE